MKKIILFLSLLSYTFNSTAQESTKIMEKEPSKKIEVTGFAEMEVVPDELYFTISLKEYFKDEKNQKDKISIDVLEKQLIASVTKAGLTKENLTIGGVSGYKNWYGKKKPQIFLEGKQYILKLSNLYKVDGVLADVDEKGIEYVTISRTENSKIAQLRKEIKIKALQAAKEKATYLLESINEKVGDILEIEELDDQYYSPQPMMMANMRMAKTLAADTGGADDSSLEFQKIKLSYKMKATFRIK